MCSVGIRYQKGRKIRGVKKGRPKIKHQNTCQQKLTTIFSHKKKHQKINCCKKQKKVTRNKMKKKMKEIKCSESKMEKKVYGAFPDHLDVQSITSTLSSLKFDTPLEECFTILGNLLACFEGSS
jgi:hypothetical protein